MYGTPDTSTAHKAVVALSVPPYMCTGTLITRDVVLTAAHCVDNYEYNPSGIDVYFGNSLSSITASRDVSEVWVSDGWDSQLVKNDIAMIRLSSLAPSYVTPIPPLPTSLEVTTADIGDPMEFVGYGETEDPYSSDEKLKVTNNLDHVCTSAMGCYFGPGGSYTARTNTLCYDMQPGGPCSGDSGGPAFIFRNGQEYVAGITSYGDQDCELFGCSTKVDEYQYDISNFVGSTLANGEACSSPIECQSNNCVDGVCCSSSCSGICRSCALSGYLGTCRDLSDNESCNDGNVCNGPGTCQSGECVSLNPLDCDDQNPCTTDSCNPSSGCQHVKKSDGSSCSDGDICNGVEKCQSGNCQSSSAISCDDQNPCTTDSCDPVEGCQRTIVDDNTSCSNGNICDGQETCVAGNCVSETSVECDDHNPCTNQECDPLHGCQYTAVTDGTNCGGGVCGEGSCQAGECMSVGHQNCRDDNPCTHSWCDPQNGCQNEVALDGTECGESSCGEMYCQAGSCQVDPDDDCVESVNGSGCGCGLGGNNQNLDLVLFLVLLFLCRRRNNPQSSRM
jgi:hypothetical protein